MSQKTLNRSRDRWTGHVTGNEVQTTLQRTQTYSRNSEHSLGNATESTAQATWHDQDHVTGNTAQAKWHGTQLRSLDKEHSPCSHVTRNTAEVTWRKTRLNGPATGNTTQEMQITQPRPRGQDTAIQPCSPENSFGHVTDVQFTWSRKNLVLRTEHKSHDKKGGPGHVYNTSTYISISRVSI
jgi:hypothetical protein